MSEPLEKDAGTDDDTALRVECYAGYRADTEPRRMHIGRREVLVTEIIDRWLDPRQLSGGPGLYRARVAGCAPPCQRKRGHLL